MDAELAGRRLRERRGVEPGVDALARSRSGYGSPTMSARLVPKLSFRPPASAAVIVIGKPRWNVAMPLTCQPPTSAFLSAGCVAGDLLPLSERQVVDEAADEPVIDVEVRSPAIELRAAVVEQALPAVERRRADPRRGRLVVGALRPRVDDRRDERAGVALELRVHRVVVGSAREVAVDVHHEVRERLALRHRFSGFAGSYGSACAMFRRISRFVPLVPM